MAINQRLEAIWDVTGEISPDNPLHLWADREAAPLLEKHSALADRMVALPARTPEGLRAKGQFLLCYLSNGGVEPEVAASLAHDVMGQA